MCTVCGQVSPRPQVKEVHGRIKQYMATMNLFGPNRVGGWGDDKMIGV